MELKYYINETLIQEPIGMETFKESLKRIQYHGVVKLVSIEPLEFYGNAYDIITAAYATDLDSELRFIVEKKCNDSDAFVEEYSGMIDLSTYYVVTGDYCSVRCNVGDITDEEIKFNNRSETVVNIEQLTDLDGGELSAYSNLNLVKTIPAKPILFQAKILTETNDTNNVTQNDPVINIMPKLEIVRVSEVGVIYSDDEFEHSYGEITFFHFRNTDGLDSITVDYRFDLSVTNNNAAKTLNIQAAKAYSTTIASLGSPVQLVGAVTSSFVISGTTTINTTENHRILLIAFQTDGTLLNAHNFDITCKSGSFVNYKNLETKENTTAKLSLIHETLSRTAEIVSGLTVKSDYYAREDSQVNPLNSGFGDGSLKSLVTGMKLRNGVQTDGTLPVLQSSFKDLFLNLNAIDNIGFGVEKEYQITGAELYGIATDEITMLEAYENNIKVGDIIKEIADSGDISSLKIRVLELVSIDTIRVSADVSAYEFELLDNILFIRTIKYVRIEPFEYFYDPTNVALTVNSPAEITRKIEIGDIYTRLTVGYEKYSDIEEVNSVDTFHTVRNYTTRLKATDKENKQVSKFVACPYAIEFTRRKSLEKTTEDWKYDESTFVLEMLYFDGAYYVKQGMSDTNGTVVSPETMYNVALSPARNALRHIANMFGFNHSGLNLYITGFTGNVTAEGVRTEDAGDYFLQDSAGGVSLKENQPLERTFNPLKAEQLEFEYPLTPAEWEALKLAPYKIITVDGEDAYIDEVTREVTTGLTKFKLIPKNG